MPIFSLESQKQVKFKSTRHIRLVIQMDRKRNRWVVQIRPVQVKGKKKRERKEKKIRHNAYPRIRTYSVLRCQNLLVQNIKHNCPAHNLLEPKLRCLLLEPVTCQSSILLKWDSYYSISVSAVYSQPKKEKKKQLSVFVINRRLPKIQRRFFVVVVAAVFKVNEDFK